MEDAGFFLLGLPIQSIAVRVVLAALVAVPLVRLVLRAGLRTPRARVAASFVPAIALVIVLGVSLRDARLPELWVPFSGRGLPVLVDDSYFNFAPLAVSALLALWAVVAAGLVSVRLVRILRARRGVQALLLQADDPTPRVRALLAEVSCALNVEMPRLAIVPGCPGGAAVIGVRQPALVVDRRLVDRLDDAELEGVLAHEVAHIKRRDNLASLALAFLRDVFFFVPGGGWAVRQLHDEREVAADQCAIEATRRPGALASGLLKVLDTRGAAATGCSALLPSGDRGTLVNRVQLLVEPPTVTTRRRVGEGVVVVSAALLATATGVVAPSTLSESSGIDAVSLVWSTPGSDEPAAVIDTGEARAFEVYRSTPIDVEQARRSAGLHLDDADEMRPGMLWACAAGDTTVCSDADPVFALGITPRSTVRLDSGLVDQWRAEQVLSTSVGLHLYVMRNTQRPEADERGLRDRGGVTPD